MSLITRPVKTLHGIDANNIPAELISGGEPVLFKGLVKHWPLVQAALQSDQAAADYLLQFYDGKAVTVSIAPPESQGRFFYNDDLTQLNFAVQNAGLNQVISHIISPENTATAPYAYVGSTTVDTWLPGFRDANDIGIKHLNPLVSLWIGGRTRVAAHYDAPENIACTVIGKRRFTLFPPDQIKNLYPGPLDFTPAGQTISLVDFANPDFERFPDFAKAIEHGMVADMEPGDALYLPSMWWHHVEGLSNFNMLVNYWWRTYPKFMGQGVTALQHALLSLRDLPKHEKQAWKEIFDFYIFGDDDVPRREIPEQAQGSLAPLDDLQARKIRSLLINKLNR